MSRVVPAEKNGGTVAYRLRCRCGATAEITTRKPTGHIPTFALKRRFTRMGWYMAGKQSKDLCPLCAVITGKKSIEEE